MNPTEKERRCVAAWDIAYAKIPAYSLETPMCKVYGRNVGHCEDCAFSTTIRPMYLRERDM
jgi:hypothetical protein